MKIAFCSSEVFPYAKTGGLADVSAALPYALSEKGMEVKIFMPFYKGVVPEIIISNECAITRISKNLEVVFIRSDPYFFRKGLYGTKRADFKDNVERYSYFCKTNNIP